MNSKSYSRFLAQMGVTLVKGRTANCKDPESCCWTILLPGPFGWEWGFSSLSELDKCFRKMTRKQLPIHKAVCRFREMCLEADPISLESIDKWMQRVVLNEITKPLNDELKRIAEKPMPLPRHWRKLAVAILPSILGKTPQFLLMQLNDAYLSLDHHVLSKLPQAVKSSSRVVRL